MGLDQEAPDSLHDRRVPAGIGLSTHFASQGRVVPLTVGPLFIEKHSDGLAVSGSRSRSGPPAEPDEAAIAAGAGRPPPAMRQGEPDEGRLEIPRVDPGQRGERLEPGETPRVSLGLAQAEVLGRPAGPLVAGRTSAWPDAAQLAQEEPDRGRAPTGQL